MAVLGIIIGLIGLKPMISDYLSKKTDEEKAASEKQQTLETGNKESAPQNDNCAEPPVNVPPSAKAEEQKKDMRPNGSTLESPKPSNVVYLFGNAKRAVASSKHKVKRTNQRPHCKDAWKIRGQKQHRPS